MQRLGWALAGFFSSDILFNFLQRNWYSCPTKIFCFTTTQHNRENKMETALWHYFHQVCKLAYMDAIGVFCLWAQVSSGQKVECNSNSQRRWRHLSRSVGTMLFALVPAVLYSINRWLPSLRGVGGSGPLAIDVNESRWWISAKEISWEIGKKVLYRGAVRAGYFPRGSRHIPPIRLTNLLRCPVFPPSGVLWSRPGRARSWCAAGPCQTVDLHKGMGIHYSDDHLNLSTHTHSLALIRSHAHAPTHTHTLVCVLYEHIFKKIS